MQTTTQYWLLLIGIMFTTLSCQKPQNSNKMDNNGLVSIESLYAADETISRLQNLLEEKDFHIFTIIDHGRSAEKYDRNLNPTQVIIFGNPKTGGTFLMQENQRIGIDLPAKILVWTNDENTTFITYNKMDWIANRHQLSDKNKEIIDNLNSGISTIVKEASGQ